MKHVLFLIPLLLACGRPPPPAPTTHRECLERAKDDYWRRSSGPAGSTAQNMDAWRNEVLLCREMFPNPFDVPALPDSRK